MLWVIGFLLAGMIIGLLLRKNIGLQKYADKTTIILVYALLFTLGLSAGSNKTITSQFHLLGFTAILISLFTTTGSIFLGWVIFKLFFLHKDHEE
jgi:uncharacterized membrane protein YbjE (DUF340 family)